MTIFYIVLFSALIIYYASVIFFIWQALILIDLRSDYSKNELRKDFFIMLIPFYWWCEAFYTIVKELFFEKETD